MRLLVIRATLLIFIILLTPSLPQHLTAQDDENSLIFFDALPFAPASGTETLASGGRIDLIAAIPYKAIDFVKDADGFSARYRIRLTLSQGETQVFDTSWTRSVTTTEFGKTDGTKPAFEFFQQRVPVPSGQYSARLEILDYETNLVSRARRDVTVIDFNSYPFSLSGLMPVGKIKEKDDGGYGITPLLSDNISLAPEGYFLFFEVYNRTENDTFEVTARYLSEDGTEVWREDWRKRFPSGTSQQWLRFPVEGFGEGNYIVEVQAFSPALSNDTLAAAKRVVSIRGTGSGMPLSEAEIEEKVKKLRYVASQKDMDYIEGAENFRDKRRRYAEFWERLDPTPGTSINEAMEEYFRRIDYADKNFRSYAEGWLTDMGRIYIVYGPPDRIDNDPFASEGKPRRTWEYYSRHASIVFIDQTGFGDFRLATPVPLSEKFRY